ncbi:cell division protein ZapA [Senegalia massiliensis]|uniref:Cell division protein ZapA n=1 Tax=Senegalia massiliensis TaxID=1720316 RepID=A0A845QTU2_9CLOT|nr:cell division protein ZapA [Senegalia massiliensis]NBI05454.1 cell division protein ZapA [Senegalia massiliensis]
MAEKRKVIVKINGQDYTVIGEESEEYINHIANYIDSKMKEIINKNNKFSQSMAAILTAFTITDEYYKVKLDLEDLKEEIKEPLEELDRVKSENSELNIEAKKLKSERDEVREELYNVKKQNDKNSTLAKDLKDSLQLKEKELEESEKMINGLQNKLFENQVELIKLKKELEELKNEYDK